MCPGCEKIIAQAHPYMQGWFRRRKAAHPDLHASWAWRGMVDQNTFLSVHRSDLAWPKSTHNRMVPIDPSKPMDASNEKDPNARPESLAIDVFQVNAGHPMGLWDPVFCAKLNGESIAAGEAVKWGGLFKDLGDKDHFEYAGPV